MSDDTELNPASGGDFIATDDIGGIKHQRVKIQYGTDGNATDVSTTNPLPITRIAKQLLDIGTEISRGNVPGQKSFVIPGRKDSVSSDVIDDLSQIPGTTVVPNPGGIQLEAVSDDTDDDGSPAGTGGQILQIYYLDTSGVEQTENITLNGTTPVSTVATDIDKIQWMAIITVGSNTTAVGNISLQTVGGGIVYEYIQAGGNQSLTGRIHVPTAKKGYIMGWHASGITKVIDVKLRGNFDRFSQTLQNAFNFIDNIVLNDATSPWILFPIPPEAPAGSTIKLSAFCTAGGGDGGGEFIIKLIDN